MQICTRKYDNFKPIEILQGNNMSFVPTNQCYKNSIHDIPFTLVFGTMVLYFLNDKLNILMHRNVKYEVICFEGYRNMMSV